LLCANVLFASAIEMILQPPDAQDLPGAEDVRYDGDLTHSRSFPEQCRFT
jgi:hypothetical protein